MWVYHRRNDFRIHVLCTLNCICSHLALVNTAFPFTSKNLNVIYVQFFFAFEYNLHCLKLQQTFFSPKKCQSRTQTHLPKINTVIIWHVGFSDNLYLHDTHNFDTIILNTFSNEQPTSYNHCRAMLCISAAIAVMRCPSVCLSVCHVRELRQNE